MAAKRTSALEPEKKRSLKGLQGKRRNVQFPGLLGAKLARYIVAVARTRVTAKALDIQPMEQQFEPERKKPKQDSTISKAIKRRWESDRPFECMRTETLIRKLMVGALNKQSADHAVQELKIRGHRYCPQ